MADALGVADGVGAPVPLPVPAGVPEGVPEGGGLASGGAADGDPAPVAEVVGVVVTELDADAPVLKLGVPVCVVDKLRVPVCVVDPLTVGDAVGDRVPPADGVRVGLTVGVPVGVRDGLLDAPVLGVFVGFTRVGALDSLHVGEATLGEAVTLGVGVSDASGCTALLNSVIFAHP